MKQMILEEGRFPVRTPESQGISSNVILEFLNEVERQEIDLHSLYVFKNGYQITGACRAPYEPDTLHRIYSGAKAINGLAILFAIQEGKLHLEDRLMDLFPASMPEEKSPYLEKLNVYHLLTMTTGQEMDTFRPLLGAEDSVRGFLTVPLVHEPGTYFCYNNGVPHILGLIVKKVTGEDYLEYLRPRLLEPLGIYCTVERTEKGELEGSRTVCTPEGFARLTLFYLQEGCWNGKQLLDAELMRQAGACQVPSGKCSSISFPHVDELAGYGFQTWRNQVGGYRLDGGRGQYGFIFPEESFALVCNSLEADGGLIPALFSRIVFPRIHENTSLEETAEARKTQNELNKRLTSWSCAPTLWERPAFRDDYYGATFDLEENSLSLTSLRLDWNEGKAPQITLETADGTFDVCVGLHGAWKENHAFPPMPRENERLNQVFGAPEGIWLVSGGWLSDFCFVFQVRERCWMDYNTFYCRFNGERLSLVVESNVEKLHHIRRRIPTKGSSYSDAPIEGRRRKQAIGLSR